MSSRHRVLALIGLVLSAGLSAGCSGDDGVSPPATYAVGGSVSGIQTGTLVLRNNGSDEVSLATDGIFQFPTGLPPGSAYTIEVATEPPGQVCEVVNGTGTVGQDDVDDVVVACQLAAYSVGGTVSGFASGVLVLQNNGGDDLSITGNGAFTFATGLTSGSAYEVLVATQPDGQTCVVTSGSGTVGTSDITTVTVSCEASLYTVGGTLSGLSSGSVTLTNNGGDDLALTANGQFTFATALQDGAEYDVAVADQPAGQVCTVTSESGNISTANVTDVAVACVGAYSVGGTVTGLSGSVVLQNNGGDDLPVSADGTFTFSELLVDGATYSVTVAEQPDGQLCLVSSESGVVSGANVTDVEVSCDSRAISNKIVFHSDRDGDYEIFRMRPDGSNVVQLTDNDVDDFWPVVSPDGTRIAFWSGRDGNQEIYTMAVDGSNVTRVTVNGSADRQPAWSPDGQRLAFHRVVSGTTEIFTINVNGTALVRLTNNTANDDEPAWSPNGSLIAFTSDRDGNDEIYVMSASNGSNQQNISNNAGRDGKPDWSPDGSRILFDRNNTTVDAAWLG
ncbi:MAG: hypothetical protein M8861_08950, partial [marine benthic group bacterium]|nr:hypothetical protein [Gemmatimonadota bacterium]